VDFTEAMICYSICAMTVISMALHIGNLEKNSSIHQCLSTFLLTWARKYLAKIAWPSTLWA